MAETTTTAHISTSSRMAVRAMNTYIRDRIAPIDRKTIVYGELKARGQVEFGKGGNQLEWRPRLKRRTIRAGSGNPSDVNFNQTTTVKIAQLPWRTYDMGEHTTKFERLATQGEAGYFGRIARILDDLSDDFMADWGPKFYLDGHVTGSRDMHGFESWFSNTGACIANSVFANPNDTYAGISTGLGVTGSWTPETGNGWPTGVGDVEYHSYSPFMVDYNNSLLAGTTATWANQWQHAVNECTTFMMVLQNVTPDIILMAASLLTQAKNSLIGSERFTTTADSNLTRLGFKTLQYNGIEVATEYGIPEAVAYLLTWSKLHLWVMAKQLIEVEEDNDIRTGQRLYKLDTYNNLWTDSPSYHGKLEAISAAGS